MSGIEGDGTESPGSGWGGFSAGDTAQFGTPDAPTGVSLGGRAEGGKPGESAMAQAGARGLVGSGYNIDGMTNRERSDLGFGAVEGFNPNNPTQTVDQMINTENVGKTLEWGAPKALSALAPGWGAAMLAGKSFAKLMNGTPVVDVATDVVSEVLPGYIDGKINQATGGILGKASMASGILNSLTGSPQVPSIGREVVSGIIGRPGRSETHTAAAPTSLQSEGNGDTTAAKQATPAPPAQPAPPQVDLPFASLGIDSAGWTRATQNYLEKRNVMV